MNAPDDFKEYVGFVYLITNMVTGQKYIGKKFFWSTTRKRIPGRKNRKVTIKESDWRKYKSSSKDVKADIKLLGEDNFRFEILKLCTSKTELTYTETMLQFKADVLTAKTPSGEFEYYNENICSRFYRTRDLLKS